MKTMLLLASSLALTSLLPARAQTAPAAPRNPTPTQAKAIRAKTAERRAETYQGPKVVPNSKKLGQKMLQDSKPADGIRVRADEIK
ncbi:MAG: hypothetical protein EOO62_24700 [Hymenobacter sp.]|nr:MAG: hypothetical protein EOO62_24700 [Hymenobacter sp.]